MGGYRLSFLLKMFGPKINVSWKYKMSAPNWWLKNHDTGTACSTNSHIVVSIISRRIIGKWKKFYLFMHGKKAPHENFGKFLNFSVHRKPVWVKTMLKLFWNVNAISNDSSCSRIHVHETKNRTIVLNFEFFRDFFCTKNTNSVHIDIESTF